MASAAQRADRGRSVVLPAVNARAHGIIRITRAWALVATAAALWLWLLTARALTGEWLTLSPLVLLILLLLLAPLAVLWMFYHSAHALLRLPEDLKRLIDEGKIQSSELAASIETWGGQPTWKRGWTVLRAIMELRSLVFRSKGMLVATGILLRLRFFNPLALAVVFCSFLASGAIVIGAVGASLMALILWF